MFDILFFVIIIACIYFYRKRKVKNFEDSTYYSVTRNTYQNTITDKGRYGEYLVYKRLMSYEKEGARFFFNCYIPKGNGQTTELDVVMVHHSGIYVFESKNYSGWIFGNETNRTWTQVLKGSKGSSHKEHFFNPVMQNELHISCLRKLMKRDDIPIYSVIAFSDRCTLMDVTVHSMDAAVVNRNQIEREVASFAMRCPHSLSQADIIDISNMLYPYTQVSEFEKKKHVETIQNHRKKREHVEICFDVAKKPDFKKENNTQKVKVGMVCPWCGNDLVLRTARNGVHRGRQFYGCSSYPKCRYIKNVNADVNRYQEYNKRNHYY